MVILMDKSLKKIIVKEVTVMKYICSRLGHGCNNHKTYYDRYAKCEHCGASVVPTQANERER